MKKLGRFLAAGALAALISTSASSAFAQDNNAGGGGRRGNFDPAQFRERMMERYKETLEVTSDDDWKALQPLVQKVLDARMGSMQGMGRGMGRPRGGADNQAQGQGQGGGQRGMFGGQQDPTADALDKAVQAKAPKAELKAALDKYVQARKAKQAELETAQESLRKVLTARQEAIATLNGLL